MFGRSPKAATTAEVESSTEARPRALEAMQHANKAVAAAEAAVRAAEDAMRGRDVVAKLDAQVALPALLAALARARADAARAEAAFKTADETWRADQAEAWKPRIAAVAQELDRHLAAACEANRRLGEVGAAARADGGGASFPALDFQWPEVNGRYPLWHERAVKMGYLLED